MFCFCIHHRKDMVESGINLEVREFGKRMKRTGRSHDSWNRFFRSNSLLMFSHHLLQLILASLYKIIFLLFMGLSLDLRFFLFDCDCLFNTQSNVLLWKLFKFFLLLKSFDLLFSLLSNMNPIILIIAFFLIRLFLFGHLCFFYKILCNIILYLLLFLLFLFLLLLL